MEYDYSSSSNLVDLVKTKDKEHTAIIFRLLNDSSFGSVSASYKEVTEFSEKVVNLLKQNNVQPNSFIGLKLNSCISLVPLMLGILKYGAAFTCVDPEEKNETWNENLYRKLDVVWVFEDAKANHDNLLTLKFFGDFVQLIRIVNSLFTNGNQFKTKKLMQSNFAFACQTSGSTGIPKIIKIPHSSVIPNILHLRSKFDISPTDVIFQAAPPTFDPSIVEIFLALSSGATLLMVPHPVKSSPLQLSQALSLHPKPTVMQVTPSLVTSLGLENIQTVLLGKNSTLRVLAFGGEPCPDRSTLMQWKLPGNNTKIFNIYGITEVSCWSTCHCIDFSELGVGEIPLGEAFPGIELHVRDKQGHVVTCGKGELFISNGNHFCHVEGDLENSSQPRWRATGDLVKVDPNGSLYFASRKSETRIIKRWGHKVSLAAVENAANQCPLVQASFALSKVTASLQLVLFVVLATVDSSKVSAVRLHIRTCLPSPALPDVIIPLTNIPLTKHGKIDKRSLKDEAIQWEKSNFNKISSSYDYDPNIIENYVKQMWMETIGISDESKVQDNSSFLASGGDSASAALLAADLLRWAGKPEDQKLITTILEATFKEVASCLQDLIQFSPNSSPKKKIRLDSQVNLDRQSKLSLKHKGTETSSKAVPVINIPIYQTYVWKEAVTVEDHPLLVQALSRGNVLPVPVDKPALNLVNLSMKMHWRIEMKKCVDASPLVLTFSNNTYLAIIASHSGRLICVNIKSGAELWKLEFNERIESCAIGSPCGQFVFIGCYDGRMYCVELETGNVCWAFQSGAMVKGSAVMYKASVIFGSYDQNVYSLNMKDGNVIWQKKLTSGALLASPCLAEDKVFVATLGGFKAALCAKTGELDWTVSGSKPFFASPALLPGNKIVFGAVDGIVTCLSTDGVLDWTYQAQGNIFSSFAIEEDSMNSDCHIYFGCSDCGVYCLNGKGEHLWTTQLGGRITSTPFLFKYPMENPCNHTLLAICRAPNHTSLINSINGTLIFEHTLPQKTFSSPVVIENFIIFGCRDDNFYCFKLEDKD